MASEHSRFVRQVTFALLVLASTATEVSAVDSRSLLLSISLAATWVGVAAAVGWFLPLPKDWHRVPPRLVLVALALLAAAPFCFEPLRRYWTGDGYPLELQMVFALRNLGLGLAACAGWLLCLRLACVVSLFLMLFATSTTSHPAVLTLLGLYAAVGSIWLLSVYWTGLQRHFVTSEVAVATEMVPGSARPPWVAFVVALGAVGGVLGLVAAGPQRAARTLGEWFWTSGGTQGYDPFARGGVNDGDDEISGDNARSTGLVASDTFLDSPLPSLYDMVNDTFGEPFKPKEVERSIGLSSQEKVKESKKTPADNLRPNREFPTTRKSPKQPRDPSDRAARALFEIQGRTPLHVRATAYDVFDGLAWKEAPRVPNAALLEKEPSTCWMAVREAIRPAAVFAENETHQFKITASSGSWLPTPPHLTRFRIGKVDRASFFGWSQERVLCLAERKTPAGIVVETECRTVAPDLLQVHFAGVSEHVRGDYRVLPSQLNPEIANLAHQWADEHPTGWPQIAAVVQHLRAEYEVDRTAQVPDDCHDPLGHFLLHSRRGPDYQFATAAAVLLRALGHPTRVVCGFYASPDDYDPVTQHTPVVQEDLHFWVETPLPSGDWLVLEPTPGYATLGPRLPLSQRLWATLAAVGAWAWRHAVALTLGLLVLGGLWWQRWKLLDALAVAIWRWFPGRTWQQCVRRSLWVLESRGRWAGRVRPGGQTVPAWLRSSLAGPAAHCRDLEQLTRMLDWAAYAPGLAAPWERAEARCVCRHVLDYWSLQRWRTIPVADSQGGVRP